MWRTPRANGKGTSGRPGPQWRGGSGPLRCACPSRLCRTRGTLLRGCLSTRGAGCVDVARRLCSSSAWASWGRVSGCRELLLGHAPKGCEGLELRCVARRFAFAVERRRSGKREDGRIFCPFGRRCVGVGRGLKLFLKSRAGGGASGADCVISGTGIDRTGRDTTSASTQVFRSEEERGH